MRSVYLRRARAAALTLCVLGSLSYTACRRPRPPASTPAPETKAAASIAPTSKRDGRHPQHELAVAQEQAQAGGVLGLLSASQGSHLASIFGGGDGAGSDRGARHRGGSDVLGGRGAGGLGLIGSGRGYVPLGPAGGRYGLVRRSVGGLGAWRSAPLDRDGRYATTYGPGSAALAAFDAAVASGAIPNAYRAFVGDFGAPYAPPLAPPDAAALAVRVELGRPTLPPAGGRQPLRIALRSSERRPARARLSVHLVLDTSGSMEGEPIAHARAAAEQLLAQLADADDFSLVVFSDDARLLVRGGPIGHRRAAIAQLIHGIVAGGATNIAAGLTLGYAQARGATDEPVRIVMLLSDGHHNVGPLAPDAGVAAAFHDGIETSAFGLGASYDASLMSAIADEGGGGYYYLADSSQIAAAITRELHARLMPVAQAVEVRVRLADDVAPLAVYGSHQLDDDEAAAVRDQERTIDRQAQRRDGIAADRQRDPRDGMRFFIPAFARADRHALLLDLAVPCGVGTRSLGTVELRYKDRLRRRNVVQELPLTVRFAAATAEAGADLDRGVLTAVETFAAGQALLGAAERVERAQSDAARQRLTTAAARLTAASRRLADPRLAADGERLTTLAQTIEHGALAALPLAVLLRGAGYGYLH